ncbi:MAG: hypothetical protein ABIG61_04925 [Planctomycetota bacterium]
MLQRRRGIMLVEICVAIALLSLLLGGLAVSINALSRFNKMQWVKQCAVAAGQGQLDCIAATGRKIDNKEFERLWPGIESVIEESAGSGRWSGLRLVRVTTAGRAGSKKIEVTQERYMVKGQDR